MRWQKVRMSTALAVVAAGALLGSRLSAHHAITGLFDERRNIEITGVLTNFRFVEPHGLISVEITNRHGDIEVWSAETNGPALLERRGWTRDSLRVGEAVKVEGYPARGSAKRLRMRKVTRSDGTVLIGTPPPRTISVLRATP
jgi:hypothetical protein